MSIVIIPNKHKIILVLLPLALNVEMIKNIPIKIINKNIKFNPNLFKNKFNIIISPFYLIIH